MNWLFSPCPPSCLNIETIPFCATDLSINVHPRQAVMIACKQIDHAVNGTISVNYPLWRNTFAFIAKVAEQLLVWDEIAGNFVLMIGIMTSQVFAHSERAFHIDPTRFPVRTGTDTQVRMYFIGSVRGQAEHSMCHSRFFARSRSSNCSLCSASVFLNEPAIVTKRKVHARTRPQSHPAESGNHTNA